MYNFFKKYKIEIIIFLVALIARSIFFYASFISNSGDLINTIHGYDGYYEISRNLVDNGVFSVDKEAPFSPHPLRPPLYLYYLAGILFLFNSYWFLAIINLLIGSFLPVLGYFIIKQLLPEKKIPLVVGLMLALEPFSILLSVILYTEVFFILLFFIFLLFLFKYLDNPSLRRIIWTSVFLGLATLVKPTTQFLPIIIPFVILWSFRKNLSKRYISHIAIFLMTFLLIISPWIYRNYTAFGKIGMTAQPAFNLYIYFAPTVLSLEKGTEYSYERDELKKRDGVVGKEINLSNSDFFIKRSLDEIKDYPVGIVKSLSISVFTFFTHDGMLTVFKHLNISVSGRFPKPVFMMFFDNPILFTKTLHSIISFPMVAIIISRILWCFITLMSFLGVFVYLWKEKYSSKILLSIFLVVYFAGTTTINGLGVNARFRQPVTLFIFMFAIYMLLYLKKLLFNKKIK